MFIKKKKGQSTVEYIILVAGVVAIIIFFVNSNTSIFKTTMNQTYNAATDSMVNMSTRLGNAFNTWNGV